MKKSFTSLIPIGWYTEELGFQFYSGLEGSNYVLNSGIPDHFRTALL